MPAAWYLIGVVDTDAILPAAPRDFEYLVQTLDEAGHAWMQVKDGTASKFHHPRRPFHTIWPGSPAAHNRVRAALLDTIE